MWFIIYRWSQSQEGDWARPHLCKLAWHGKWKRFIIDHIWRGRSKPGCWIVGSVTTVWLTTQADDQSSLYLLHWESRTSLSCSRRCNSCVKGMAIISGCLTLTWTALPRNLAGSSWKPSSPMTTTAVQRCGKVTSPSCGRATATSVAIGRTRHPITSPDVDTSTRSCSNREPAASTHSSSLQWLTNDIGNGVGSRKLRWGMEFPEIVRRGCVLSPSLNFEMVCFGPFSALWGAQQWVSPSPTPRPEKIGIWWRSENVWIGYCTLLVYGIPP